MSSQCFLYGEYNMHVQSKYKASHQGKEREELQNEGTNVSYSQGSTNNSE